MSGSVLRTLAAASVLGIAPSLALAHDGDIGIRAVGGRIDTVLVSGEPPSQVFGTDTERVFAVELEWNTLESAVLAEEPGYASNDASVIGHTIRPDILKSLRRWNGSEFITTSTTMKTGKLPGFPFVTTPATDVVTPTNPFMVTDDFHFDWVLNGATETTGFGIFLVEMNLVDTSANPLLPSLPYWIVFNYGEEETDHEAAIEYVQNNLVPAPSAAALLAGLGGCAARRRRR